MSWDVVLFNSTEEIADLETLNKQALKPADFGKKLKAHFRAIEEEDAFRIISVPDGNIEYEYTDLPSNNLLLSLDGEPALFALVEFAKNNKYQIYDASLDSMLNLDKPHVNGYKDYREEVKEDLKKKD
ncbi:hypothetical protein [Mucilaginibacter polytrichastri]|uniref:Uncharacterized protein n=1 Tax=Mucilaginibacter polytrichastri TaxID=1302689 RepID=A0A1Q5ZSZ6_9SPHI|nr:hypothetical protein [Mucilaginibacter polytrichastri]OKS84895.1 hypothetical protein RG47T_0332 [Mucilaginibacter polytrichastri]SFS48067.1 hypothetical protein SAMN04487890_101744 [Mucilaginibacter polytrichastri]